MVKLEEGGNGNLKRIRIICHTSRSVGLKCSLTLTDLGLFLCAGEVHALIASLFMLSLTFVLLFTVLQPPLTGGNRQKIQEKIIKNKIKLPAFLSSEAHSFLKGVNLLSHIFMPLP